MKKIINGKKYDTETAKRIASHDQTHGSFSDYYEQLFLKATGEFFLYGEGSAGSSYARQCESNSFCSGCAIRPLTLDEAKEWGERHMSADLFEETFGEVDE